MRQAVKGAEVAAMIPDGATVMVGGFLAVGTPERLVDALVQAGRKDLVVIGNDTARPGLGIGKLIDARLCRKVIVSHIGTNPETQ
ncbi:MAG TPA: CoA-transferase, partial [Geminicoccaceae bacterium]|nr:CoA-transferase [Geminicoccaceae bacterium]